MNKSLVTLEIKNQRTEKKILKPLEGKNETVRYLDTVNASTADQKFENPTNDERIVVPFTYNVYMLTHVKLQKQPFADVFQDTCS